MLGHFKATGIRPKFADRLKAYGIDLARHAVQQPRAAPVRGGGAPRRDRPALEALSDVRPATTTLVPAVLIFLAVAFGTLSLALLVDILQERQAAAGRAAAAPRVHQRRAGRGGLAAPRARRRGARWLASHGVAGPGVRGRAAHAGAGRLKMSPGATSW